MSGRIGVAIVRIPLLAIAVALSVACSDDHPPPQAGATPQTTPPPPAAPGQALQQAGATEQADVATAEVADPEAADPCDLSGYDMSQMTVDLHERLVEACQRSKE